MLEFRTLFALLIRSELKIIYMNLKDIFFLKCPRCHEGNLFKGSTYSTHVIDMPKQCEKCKQAFFLEPGFYYGAMYVSYGVNVAIALTLFVAIWAFMGFTQPFFIKSALGSMAGTLLFFPYTLRVSRAIWLGIFYKDKLTFYENIDEVIVNKGDKSE